MSPKNKKKPRLKFEKQPVPWTPFKDASFPGRESLEAGTKDGHKHFRGVFINSRYQVSIYDYKSPWGALTWLAIVNLDRSARHDWRDFQRIKNELVGPEHEAVEIYPAETRLVDTNNQFHLFILPKGKTLPLGFSSRDVRDEHLEGSAHKQRPFNPVPEDLNTNDVLEMSWPVFAAGDDDEDPYDQG